MTDLVERLRAIPGEDHVRGCDGRNYSCNCGRDETIDRITIEAAYELSLLGEMEGWRDIVSDPPPADGYLVGWDGEYPEVWACDMYHIAMGHVPTPSHWQVTKGMAEALTLWKPLILPPPFSAEQAAVTNPRMNP